MKPPADSELVGASSGEIVVQGPRTDAVVPLDAAAVRELLARLGARGSAGSAGHVYLCLDHIRGTHDATVLTVSLRLPEAAAAAPHTFVAGSVGLYGLRRASVAHAGSPGHGLGFVLDVTPFFESLRATHSSGTDALLVSIRAHRGLPAGSSVVIGQVRVLAEPPA
jgi:tyrosinase